MSEIFFSPFVSEVTVTIPALFWKPSEAKARRFVILRHAEKTGLSGDRDLSSEGRERADALRSLPQALGTLDAIFAATSVPKSARPVQTVEPLARKLALPIDTRWNTHDVSDLAMTILADRSLDRKQIVICWRHDALQALAQALGARDAPAWPNTLYDRVWLLTRTADAVDLLSLRQIIENGGIELVRDQ